MIPDFQSTPVTINDLNEVGSARRQGIVLAQSLKFDETETGRVGIVITELANNLVKHAGGGEMLFRTSSKEPPHRLEIISLDKGPGMRDINKCLEDGYSTAGSPGTGLGAVNRLAGDLQIYSQAEKGTVIVASMSPAKTKNKPEILEIGVICRAVKGEMESGDGWHVVCQPDKIKILVVDGLGHGTSAAKAASVAIGAFEGASHLSPLNLLDVLHKAMKITRGAAVAIAEVDYKKEQLSFVGVGNINGAVISQKKVKGLASFNGIVGHHLIKVQEFTYPCPADSLIVFHTDGLSPRWRLEDYPGLSSRHASLISGVLYRDFQRPRDDATALIIHKH